MFLLLIGYLLSFSYFSARLSEAIINGIDARPGEFPFVVSLRNDSGLHYCGGALLYTRRHVITSAHCLFTDLSMIGADIDERQNPESVSVLVGSIYSDYAVASSQPKNPGRLYKVQKLTPHPLYDILNENSAMYDIGVITLKERVELAYVSAIEIYNGSLEGKSAIQLGWGVSERELIGRWVTSPILKKLPTRILSPSECVDQFQNEYYWMAMFGEPAMDSSLVCTLNDTSAGTCFRDSGSPVIVDGGLVSITSFSIPCAKGYPDFGTSVAKYLDFIDNEIKNN